jgi:hypothetical protein
MGISMPNVLSQLAETHSLVVGIKVSVEKVRHLDFGTLFQVISTLLVSIGIY